MDNAQVSVASLADQMKSLQALLDAVPVKTLRAGEVGCEHPGLLAGDTPVCRLRNNPEGEAYGALIVAAVNALPQLMQAVGAQAGAAGASEHGDAGKVLAGEMAGSGRRQQVEESIISALSMQQGFPRSMTKLWAKIIYSTVEPWLSPSIDSTALLSSNSDGVNA